MNLAVKYDRNNWSKESWIYMFQVIYHQLLPVLSSISHQLEFSEIIFGFLRRLSSTLWHYSLKSFKCRGIKKKQVDTHSRLQTCLNRQQNPLIII